MERLLTRGAALFCAAGAAGLLWTFGVFIVVPWRAGRLLALNAAEAQVLGVSLSIGLATAWGALHVLALAGSTKTNAAIRILLIAAWCAALTGGVAWSLGRVA